MAESNDAALGMLTQMAQLSKFLSKNPGLAALVNKDYEQRYVTTVEEEQPLNKTLPSPQNTCVVCEGGANLHCSRCKFTSYCGKTCQRKDWPKHKAACICSNPIRKWHRARLKAHENAKGKEWYTCDTSLRRENTKFVWGLPRDMDMQSLYHFLYGKRILELGCGNMALYNHFKLFARCNRKEHLAWTPTDLEKAPLAHEPFLQCSGMTAVKKIPHDVIVVSWPEYPGKGWLLPVFEFLLKMGKLPFLVYIGEKKGGSSMERITWEFIETYYTTVAQVSAAQWPFIHDIVSIFRPND